MATESMAKIDASVLLLRKKLPITADGLFETRQTHVGVKINSWLIIAAWKNKLALIHEKLNVFAKAYSPNTKDYASSAYQCLLELSSLDHLPLPILPPVAHMHQTIIFEKGKVLKLQPAQIPYSYDHLSQIETVMRKFKFRRIEMSSPLGTDVVQIGNKQFLIDPIHDLPAEIASYVG